MPIFVISWMDKPGSLERRMGAREAHLAHIHQQGDKVKLGGPFLGPDGQMAGSMILFEADSIEEAQAFHDTDPYKLAGLFDRSEVRAWRLTTGAWGPPKS
jgi:uncharacterized protein YciI